jgi:hypothetical protein
MTNNKIVVLAIGSIRSTVTAMSHEERLINAIIAIIAPLAKERFAKLGTPHIGMTADEGPRHVLGRAVSLSRPPRRA